MAETSSTAEPMAVPQMKWATALSTRPSLEAAVNEVVETAQSRLGCSADVGFLFISGTFASEYPRLLPLLKERLALPTLVGCGGGGIIGNPVGAASGMPVHEIEDEPALCLCLGHLPGVTAQAFWLDEDRLPDLDSPPQDWWDYVGVDPASQPDFVLIADPVTSKIKDLLQGFDFAYPTAVKVGGLASGGGGQRSNGLFCNDQYYEEGCVGLALSGAVQVKAVVAQGCRPVGPIFRVVKGQRNVILELEPETDGAQRVGASATPLEYLQSLLQELTDDERALAQHSLFVGVAHSAFRFELEQGDFLIRNLVGIDPKAGAVAVGDRVRSGQRIQFHLRDDSTSTADLLALLKQHRAGKDSKQTAGALMFSCLGRGEDLYDRPHHDSSLFREVMGDVPVSGFFCAGEIGPINGATYLHGYTAVFGIITPG